MTDQEYRCWALELAAKVAPDAGQIVDYAQKFFEYIHDGEKEDA